MERREIVLATFVTFLSAMSIKGGFLENVPPQIYNQPKKKVLFIPESSVHLPCEAVGLPNPIVKWYKNQIEIDFSRPKYRLQTNDTLTITHAQRSDEGVYQCKATNFFAASLSVKSMLREARMDIFPTKPVQHHKPLLGESFTLPCIPPDSVPKAAIKWAVVDRNKRLLPLEMSNRISMDDFGNLHFANVQPEDAKDGKSYVCVATNYILRSINTGPEHKIQPRGDISVSRSLERPPELVWSSPRDTLGIKGKNLKLKCIFSGNPTPDVYWYLPKTAEAFRIAGLSGEQELTIRDSQETDEGIYTCTGVSSIGNRVSQSINVQIESEPQFVTSPRNVLAKSGKSVTFLCKAEGKPTPTIRWYVNGVNLQDSMHSTIQSARFLHPDVNNITFVDVKTEDTMCIQCNASNVHGYVFADVYLNVIQFPPF